VLLVFLSRNVALSEQCFCLSHYGLVAKFAKVGKGPNPYIDPAGFKAHVDEYERQFLEELKKQMQAK